MTFFHGQKHCRNLVKSKNNRVFAAIVWRLSLCQYAWFTVNERIVDEINLCRDILEEFERFSGHTFRHTFATRCYENGVKLKTIQHYLGHANLKMTMDLYVHDQDEHRKSEMSKLENVLDGLLDVSNDVIEKRYEDYLIKEEKNDNIIYLKATNQ